MEEMTKEEWANNLAREHSIVDTRVLTTPQVESWLKEYNHIFGGSCSLESFRRILRKAKRNLLIELSMLPDDENTPIKDPDEEIIEANVKLQKQKQLYMDTNRVERKAFREYARVENAVTAYGAEIVKLLKEHGKQLTQYNPPVITDYERDEVGIIQLTDHHLNELIDLPHNKFDFKVASHRLFKLYKESLNIFKARGIKKVVVACTADMLNSDRRLSEMTNKATNRSKATFCAVDLYKHFLLALTNDFHVSVVSVLGNESRVGEELTFANETLSDNYDFVIMNMVRLVIESSGNKNIEFGSLDQVETVIEVKGHKILLSHDLPKSTATQKGTQGVIGKQYLQGNPVDCMMGGHIHSTMNQMYGYRSSALCGSNSYSDNALHLAGRAGQNIYLFGEGYRHVISIDLQNYTEGEWFDIDDTLMEYHAKSLDKVQKKETIMSIVI